jgi:hypothetical protein
MDIPPVLANPTNAAIEQLSYIILSKDKADLVSRETKSLVEKGFGETFSKIVEAYEDRIAELSEAVEETVREAELLDLIDRVTAALEAE